GRSRARSGQRLRRRDLYRLCRGVRRPAPDRSRVPCHPRLAQAERRGGTGEASMSGVAHRNVRRKATRSAAARPEEPLHALYSRPGFLIRRAHQIAVSLFIEEMDALGVTPTQSGILFVLSHRSGLDQISVARLLGLDRSTASMVIAKLVSAGLVSRGVGV